jgi:hypothetical protein
MIARVATRKPYRCRKFGGTYLEFFQVIQTDTREIIGVDDNGELILGAVIQKGGLHNVRHCITCEAYFPRDDNTLPDYCEACHGRGCAECMED